jgi:hypothetical protein
MNVIFLQYQGAVYNWIMLWIADAGQYAIQLVSL